MFHLAANYVAIGQTADTDVVAIADSVLNIQNSHFVLPQPMDLWAAFLSSLTMTRGKITFPSISQYGGTWIRPQSNALLPPTDPNVADYRRSPFRIPAFEEIRVLATSGLACMTEAAYALLVLGAGVTPVPPGNIWTIRGTSTTAGVAKTWTGITMTWDNQLPDGRYAVIGSNLVSATGIAHRLIFNGQVWRPGGLSFATAGLRTHEMFIKGGLGVWGYFQPIFYPNVEVLDNATGNAHTLFLDCVKVG